ncbi:hypothetical protein [Bacillus sp. B-jedd]|uniref:hypothetical protein n=1 Tax=Bacillus sp. B-jedd TaxID=1476857 RepID=UPI0005156C86|nr:hypothetical protein [Bacillus sp. B-jedd]CEG25704.1 hypothetical protein BN1002_00520 [Bacillus sp. B-jedd]
MSCTTAAEFGGGFLFSKKFSCGIDSFTIFSLFFPILQVVKQKGMMKVEKKKKKSGFRWLLGGFALLAVVLVALHFAGRNGMIHQYYFPGQSQAQGFMQDTFQKGKEITGNFNGQAFEGRGGMMHGGMGHGPKFGQPGDMMGRHHGFNGHHGFGFGFGGIFFVLGGLLLALIGLYVRGKSDKKWLGNALIVLGLLPLLARLPILPLILIGVIVYWLVKKVRPGQKFEAAPVSFQPEPSMNGQFLDEWERTNNKEEN